MTTYIYISALFLIKLKQGGLYGEFVQRSHLHKEFFNVKQQKQPV